MAETNGGRMGEYQPRHAAAQLDTEFMETLIRAADQYCYQQMHEEFDAKFALVRARLFAVETTDDAAFNEFVESQRWRIARAVGRQAMAKAYADSLRAQLYCTIQEGEQPYRGRHRSENQEERQETAPAEQSKEEAREPKQAEKSPEQAAPERKPVISVPEQGRLRHIITDDSQIRPHKPPKSQEEAPADKSKEKEGEEKKAEEGESSFPVPAQAAKKERTGLLAWLRRAWYAGGAAISAFFAHPEKGRRRRALAQTAAILGGVAAVLAAAEFADRAPDRLVQPPTAPEPAGPAPNTEEFFDALKPDAYNGEPYEWTAVANHVGPSQATPKLLRLIEYARTNGLTVDTWGDPDRGRWGITNVTVHLPDGTHKSYYDTPRKLAIIKWYAGGMAHGFRS